MGNWLFNKIVPVFKVNVFINIAKPKMQKLNFKIGSSNITNGFVNNKICNFHFTI